MHAVFPQTLAYPLAASLGLSLFKKGRYLLYPFRLFTTWVHECCHAASALLMGGSVTRITLAADTSGLTQYKLPPGRFRHAFVASSGYLGSSVAGCFLYYLTLSSYRDSHTLILALGAVMILSLLFWVRGIFGALSVALLGGAMIALGWKGQPHLSGLVLAFLAIQTGLNALFDIRTLFSLDPHDRSDAHTMQKLFFLPSWCWATLWLGMSASLAWWTVQHTPI
jgi:hypothetical protein